MLAETPVMKQEAQGSGDSIPTGDCRMDMAAAAAAAAHQALE